MLGIVTFESDDKIYLLCDKEGAVSGYSSQAEAVRQFETMYNQAHDSGYEHSMSACIHGMHFKVACHAIEDVQALVGDVVVIPFRSYSVRSVAGRMFGILCLGSKAKEFHESGVIPRLISP